MYTINGNANLIKDIKVTRELNNIRIVVTGWSSYFDGEYANDKFQIHDNNDLESTMVNGILQRNKNSCTITLDDKLTAYDVFSKKEHKKITWLLIPLS